jgi:argininosuccinate lyase
MPKPEEMGHTSAGRTDAKWSGRFAESVDARVLRYTASVGFDQRLAEFDIAGSLAHARMLAACGVIGAADLADIERGMAAIRDELRAGKFEWSLEAEDVHLNIERRLIALVGDAGKRCTRSRGDQVATDVRPRGERRDRRLPKPGALDLINRHAATRSGPRISRSPSR